MTIEGATVIKTGYSRGSGYDKIYLRKLDRKVVVLEVENTSDDDTCIGISDMVDTLKEKIKGCEEEIKGYEKRIKEIENW